MCIKVHVSDEVTKDCWPLTSQQCLITNCVNKNFYFGKSHQRHQSLWCNVNVGGDLLSCPLQDWGGTQQVSVCNDRWLLLWEEEEKQKEMEQLPEYSHWNVLLQKWLPPRLFSDLRGDSDFPLQQRSAWRYHTVMWLWRRRLQVKQSAVSDVS